MFLLMTIIKKQSIHKVVNKIYSIFQRRKKLKTNKQTKKEETNKRKKNLKKRTNDNNTQHLDAPFARIQ